MTTLSGSSSTSNSYPGLKALLDLKLKLDRKKGFRQASEEDIEEALEEIYGEEVSDLVSKRLREESFSSNIIVGDLAF